MAHGNDAPRSLVVAVTGASGLVGSHLIPLLESRGHLVRRLVRRPVQDGDHEIEWNPAEGTIDAAELNGVDAVVHLAGEGVASERWNERVKRAILDSRVDGTRLLCQTLAELDSKPSVLVSASAIGYYGPRGAEPIDETSPPGDGFLAEVCQAWEHETRPASEAGIRVVNLRIGVVLSTEGGALKKMLTPFKLGLGGVMGSGEQYISWIELGDLVRIIELALTNDSLSGPVNATAPHPATNRELTKTLGKVLGRPTIFPMPAFAARLAFGEMADEMLLTGAKILPKRLETAKFQFSQPQLEGALRHLLE
ncbi:MAG: TIGR01777 family oxidoreductase [Pirellulales bacterium]